MPKKQIKAKRNLGPDAIVSILANKLHPPEHVKLKFPDPIDKHQRLSGCTVLRQELKKINYKDQMAVIVTHPDFINAQGEYIELYAVKRWFHVEVEGPLDLVFDDPEEIAKAEEKEETMEDMMAAAAAAIRKIAGASNDSSSSSDDDDDSDDDDSDDEDEDGDNDDGDKKIKADGGDNDEGKEGKKRKAGKAKKAKSKKAKSKKRKRRVKEEKEEGDNNNENNNTDESSSPKKPSLKKKKSGKTQHELISLPPNKRFDKKTKQLVETKTKYLQKKCKCGACRVRTYCSCSPDVFFCTTCFGKHVVKATKTDILKDLVSFLAS